MSKAEIPRQPDSRVDQIAEIYGECATYVSQNDIDNLRDSLPPAEFAELSARLGWIEESTIVGSLGARGRELLAKGDRAGAVQLLEEAYEAIGVSDPDLDGDEDL